MNIKGFIGMMAATALTACSSDNPEIAVHDTSAAESLYSTVPIVFAPVDLADMQWDVEYTDEDATRGGSVDASDFTVDSVGLFCLSRTQLEDAPKPVSWSGGYPTAEQNLHNVWSNNEMTRVESIGGNKGKIVWENNISYMNSLYYPLNAWYTYCFVAYHPWTPYVEMSKSYVAAYFHVDGNDDVLYAFAKAPSRKFDDAEVDNLAFSKQYYDKIKEKGYEGEDIYPVLQFRHLMSRLDFSFCFSEMPDMNYHVEKVEFDNFFNLMRLMLVRQQNGDAEEYPARLFMTSLPSSFPNFTSYTGHFELREKGETPICGIREGSEYKYNLSTEFKKVGDCILIPPAENLPSARQINLFVTLCDDYGKKYRNKAAIALKAPSAGWLMGQRYDVKITLNPPTAGSSTLTAADQADPSVSLAPGLEIYQTADFKGTATIVPRP